MKVKIAWKIYWLVLVGAIFPISVFVRYLLGEGCPTWYPILMVGVEIAYFFAIILIATRIEREINQALDKIDFEGSFRQALARISILEDFRYNTLKKEDTLRGEELQNQLDVYAALYERETIEAIEAIEMLRNMDNEEENNDKPEE